MREPRLVFYAGSTLLEGPVWDSRRQLVYCVSIEQNLIYQVDPQSGSVHSFPTRGSVGCVLIKESGELISAEKEGLFCIDPDTGNRRFLEQIEQDSALRYNDGILDPAGRILVGTKTEANDVESYGNLYSYDGETVTVLVSDTGISNGMGFSADGRYFYFIDTPTRQVKGFHYDPAEGTATYDRIVVEIDGDGYPDGMCVDPDGHLWIAEWEGGRVCKWDPDGGIKLATIGIPCKRVTSCCLGGPDLDTLFISTAKTRNSTEAMAGGLFSVRIC